MKEKKNALQTFGDGRTKTRLISSVKALNAGLNVPECSLGICAAGSSKALDNIQRTGRTLRLLEGKIAIYVNLYVKPSPGSLCQVPELSIIISDLLINAVNSSEIPCLTILFSKFIAFILIFVSIANSPAVPVVPEVTVITPPAEELETPEIPLIAAAIVVAF